MPHISKKKLKISVIYDVVDVFAKTLCGLRGKSGERIVGELFTRTEILMLSKRLAMILLVEAGYSDWTIKQKLGVSTSTVRRMRHRSGEGAFKAIEELQQKKRDREELWKLIEKVARGGLPPQGARWHRQQKTRSLYKTIDAKN